MMMPLWADDKARNSTHVCLLRRRKAVVPEHGRHPRVLCELPNHSRLRELPNPLSSSLSPSRLLLLVLLLCDKQT